MNEQAGFSSNGIAVLLLSLLLVAVGAGRYFHAATMRARLACADILPALAPCRWKERVRAPL